MSAYYLCANRGKRSIALDLASREGVRQIQSLAQEADVLIENFKVGQLARLGLGSQDLQERNPGLIYCSITGYGQDGPHAHRAGYDFAIQAAGGLMSITGESADVSGSEPQKVGVAVVDLMTGVYAVTAILAALHERQHTGRGRHIDMALLDVQVAMLANQASNHLVGGLTPRRMGNTHPNIVPYQVFATRDGHLVLAVGNDLQFRKFCECAGRPEAADDLRFVTNAERVRHRTELVPQVAGWLLERDTSTWIETLDELGVPCAPIQDIAQVFNDPQVLASGLEVSLPTPQGTTVPVIASPVRFDGSRAIARTAPPALDLHGRHIRDSLARSPAWPLAEPSPSTLQESHGLERKRNHE